MRSFRQSLKFRHRETQTANHYSHLNEGEIRLITLEPGSPGSRIQCSIGVFRLDQVRNEYEALSYAWGDPKRTTTIKVGGQAFAATISLESALQHLRSTDGTRQLWVDALCINQGDNEERSAQVQTMSNIYRGASCVLIWLGKIDEKSALAFDMVERSITPSIDDMISRFPERFADWGNSRDEIRLKVKEHFNNLFHRVSLCQLARTMDANLYDFDRDPTICMEAISHTFSPEGKFSWWKRLWVVQEVLHARQARFVCGTRSISLDDLPRVLDGLAYCAASAKTWFALRNLIHVLTLEEIRIGNSLFDDREPNQSLERSMKTFQTRECSDPRDRIYSLINVSHFNVSQILPDYSKNALQVFIEASRAIISESRSLNMIIWLKCTQITLNPPSQLNNLPTWVPDFSNWPKPVGIRMTSETRPFFTEDQHGLYKAAGTSKLEPTVFKDEEEFILELKGIFVDTIDTISSPTWKKVDGKKTESFRFLEPEVLDNDYITGGSTEDAFWRTLLKDLHCSPDGPTLSGARIPEDQIARQRWLFQHWTGRDGGSLSVSTGTHHGPEYFIETLMRRENKGVITFITTKLGYMGLVERNVEKGDSVFVVRGCSVPLILRPTHAKESGGSQYTLICRAYVHGIMDGEMLSDVIGQRWELEPKEKTVYLV